MGLGKTLILGLIAGVTILLGLPIGRLQRPAPSLRVMLNAIAVGILVFLVWDVLSAAWAPIDGALSDFHAGNGGLAKRLRIRRALRRRSQRGPALAGCLRAVDGPRHAPPRRDALRGRHADERRCRPGRGWRGRRGGHAGRTTACAASRRGRPRGNSRCSSRWASVCTTSPKGSPSVRRPRRARSRSRHCSSSASRCTTRRRASASSPR